MFFLFGFGPHLEQTGYGEYRTCPRCNNHTRWLQVQQSQRFSLFFIPVVTFSRKTLEQCSICGESRETPFPA